MSEFSQYKCLCLLLSAGLSVVSAQTSYADNKINTLKVAKTHPVSPNQDQSIKLRSSIVSEQPGLEVSISNALSQSFELRAALLDDEAAQTDVLGAYAAFLPTVTGNVTHSWNRGSTKSQFTQSKGRSTEFTTGLNLSLPLYSGGRNFYGLKQANASKNATKASIIATRFKVELEVAQAYFSLLRDQTIESRFKRAVAAHKTIRHVTAARYRAGDASRTDIALANSALKAMQAEYVSARGRRNTSAARVKSLTRSMQQSAAHKFTEAKYLPPSLDQAKSLVVSRNPNLIAAFHQVDAARHQANVVRANSLPQLSLVAGYSYQRTRFRNPSREKESQIGLNLAVPLVDLRNLASYKASKLRATASYYRALDLRRNILQQLEIDWHSYHAARDQRIAFSGQVRSLSKAIVGVTKEYRAGLRSITDVLNAQVNKVRAEALLAQAKFEEQSTKQSILIALGTTAQQVRQVAQR